MMFLWLLSWIAVAGELTFIVFSLAIPCVGLLYGSAAGLYYLAELIEEYSVLAKRIISTLLLIVIIFYILLIVVDGFPWGLTLTGVSSHIFYGSLLRTFPEIKILSVGFLAGSVCLIASHIFAFQYFAEEYYPFQEVVGFFFLCQWLIPFSLFISLTANDLVLPTIHPGTVDSFPCYEYYYSVCGLIPISSVIGLILIPVIISISCQLAIVVLRDSFPFLFSVGPDGMGQRRPRRSGFLSLFDLLSAKLTDIIPSRSSKRL